MSSAAIAALHPAAAGPAAAPTSEQGNPVGFYLGGVLLIPVLVVPLAGLEPSLHIDLLTLGEVLLQALRLLAPEDDAVPLGLFLLLPALVVPHFGRRKVQSGHG